MESSLQTCVRFLFHALALSVKGIFMPGAQFLCHISQNPHSGHKYSSFIVIVLDIQGHLWLFFVPEALILTFLYK